MYVRTHVCMRITKVCIPMYTNMYIHKHTHTYTRVFELVHVLFLKVLDISSY